MRVHLTLLALLALLPAWGAAGIVALRSAEAERARVVQAAHDTARDTAAAVEREAATLRASLRTIAAMPAPLLREPAVLAAQAALLRGAEGLGLTLLTGPIAADGPVPTTPSGDPGASDLQRDPATGRLLVRFALALPAGPDGSGPAVLALSADALAFWSPILERARLSDGWIAAVLDGDGTILARAPDAARFVGQPVHPDARAALDAAAAEGGGGASGWRTGRARDGAPVHIAWRHIPGLPWTVLVGVPRDAVDGALQRALLPILLAGLPALIGVSLGVAAWGTRRLARPLRALEAAAATVGEGQVPRPPPPSGVREIDAVGAALVAAAAARRDRQAERAALAARLAMVLESTTDSVIVLDGDGRLTYHNARARRLLAGGGGDRGLGAETTPAGLAGWRLLDLLRPEAREGFAAVLATAREGGVPASTTIALGPAGPWHAADAFPTPDGLTLFLRDVTATHAAEQALRESEARLQAVLDHVPVGVLMADAATGRIILSNRRLAEMLGERVLRPDRAIDYGRAPAADADGREVPPGERPLARAMRGEEQASGEYRFRRRDGRGIWLRVRAVPIRDAAGRVVRAVAAMMDIDAEREASEALRQSELRFRTLAEAVPQIVWSSSGRDGQVDYFNPRFFEFTGLSPRSLPAPADLPIHPEDRPQARALWQEARTRGQPYEAEYRLRRADGVWRWMVARALPARDEAGVVQRWIGSITDMTELIETRQALERQVAAEAAAREAAVAAAEALSASDTRFRRFAEASPDALWILDVAADRLVYASPAFERFWGAVPPPQAGLAALAAGVPAEEQARVAAALRDLAAGEAVDVEYPIGRSEGAAAGRWVRVLSFRLGGEEAAGPYGRGPRLIGGFIRDVTLRREAQERQRLLIGELNHRVKNTLATVLSLAYQTARRIGAEAGQAAGPTADAAAQVVANAGATGAFLKEFQGRLMALARAHDLLTASTWRGASLAEVAAASLSPWRGPAGGAAAGGAGGAGLVPGAAPDAGAAPPAARITVEGPRIWLAPRQALGLALAFHEMATNAAKHGALGAGETGQVALAWRREAQDPGTILLEWRETGGPPARPPVREGFGTRLLRTGLPAELGAGSEVSLDYTTAGFRASIRFRTMTAPEGETG